MQGLTNVISLLVNCYLNSAIQWRLHAVVPRIGGFYFASSEKSFLDLVQSSATKVFPLLPSVPLFTQCICAYVVAMAEARQISRVIVGALRLAARSVELFELFKYSSSSCSSYFQEYFSVIRSNFIVRQSGVFAWLFVRTATSASITEGAENCAALSHEFQKLLLKYDGVLHRPCLQTNFEEVHGLSPQEHYASDACTIPFDSQVCRMRYTVWCGARNACCLQLSTCFLKKKTAWPLACSEELLKNECWISSEYQHRAENWLRDARSLILKKACSCPAVSESAAKCVDLPDLPWFSRLKPRLNRTAFEQAAALVLNCRVAAGSVFPQDLLLSRLG